MYIGNIEKNFLFNESDRGTIYLGEGENSGNIGPFILPLFSNLTGAL